MENSVTVKSQGLRYGLFLGLAGILYSAVLQLAGLGNNQALSLVIYLIVILFMVLATRDFKAKGDGFMTFGQGFGIGAIMATINGILTSVFTYVYMKFINPAAIDEMRELAIQKMEEAGNSDAEIEQAMKITDMMMSPEILAGGGLIGMIIFGLIFAVIVAAITKKDNPTLQV